MVLVLLVVHSQAIRVVLAVLDHQLLFQAAQQLALVNYQAVFTTLLAVAVVAVTRLKAEAAMLAESAVAVTDLAIAMRALEPLTQAVVAAARAVLTQVVALAVQALSLSDTHYKEKAHENS